MVSKMALPEYTAEVKDKLVLELPQEAEELNLRPGDKVRVTLAACSLQTGVKVKRPKELRAHGMLAGVTSVDEFLKRKHEETKREDRRSQKRVSAMGKYPELTSSDEFNRRKQEEIELEERRFR